MRASAVDAELDAAAVEVDVRLGDNRAAAAAAEDSGLAEFLFELAYRKPTPPFTQCSGPVTAARDTRRRRVESPARFARRLVRPTRLGPRPGGAPANRPRRRRRE